MNSRYRTPGPRRWPYDTVRWKRLRVEILEQRGHRCEECGFTEGALELHHVVPLTKVDREDKNLERGFPHPAYLKLLCKRCHGMLTRGVSRAERNRRREWRQFIDGGRSHEAVR